MAPTVSHCLEQDRTQDITKYREDTGVRLPQFYPERNTKIVAGRPVQVPIPSPVRVPGIEKVRILSSIHWVVQLFCVERAYVILHEK